MSLGSGHHKAHKNFSLLCALRFHPSQLTTQQTKHPTGLVSHSMFPSHLLKGNGGEIYAYVHENRLLGLERSLFWSVTVRFEPIVYEGERWECSMTCEWIPWPVRDWRGLDNVRLKVESDDQLIESSFYLVAHDLGTDTEVLLQRHEANLFRVRMSMTVDFTGLTGNDRNAVMVVAGEAIVPFQGVFVTPENLYPKPTTVADVKEIAKDYIDLTAYQEPQQENHNFIFKPLA